MLEPRLYIYGFEFWNDPFLESHCVKLGMASGFWFTLRPNPAAVLLVLVLCAGSPSIFAHLRLTSLTGWWFQPLPKIMSQFGESKKGWKITHVR